MTEGMPKPSRVIRWLWWGLVISPAFVLLMAIDSALTAGSADEAMNSLFALTPLLFGLPVLGLLVALKAILDRHLTIADRLVALALSLAVAVMALLSSLVWNYIAWPEKGRNLLMSAAGIVASGLATWALIALRARVWRITADPAALPTSDQTPN